MIARLLIPLLAAGFALSQTTDTVVQLLPSAGLELRDAQSISVAADGTLYIADTGHHRVVAIDPAGQLVFETGGFGRDHGQFQWPRKVIADRGAAVWVLDYGNRRVEKFSRTLEYQGTFQIVADDGGPAPQIEQFALSPQGDLYVYDRDNGRLLRYDPLFRLQAELGQNRGAEFVSAVARMAFVRDIGLVWWEQNTDVVRVANPLLTQVQSWSLGRPRAAATVMLAAIDSCLVTGDPETLLMRCGAMFPPDTVFAIASHPGMKLSRLDDIAFADRRILYLLDGTAGAIHRVSISER